jgi:hypothetical protein
MKKYDANVYNPNFIGEYIVTQLCNIANELAEMNERQNQVEEEIELASCHNSRDYLECSAEVGYCDVTKIIKKSDTVFVYRTIDGLEKLVCSYPAKELAMYYK